MERKYISIKIFKQAKFEFTLKVNMEHKSGFVNIIGRPNVGKSTLMNALVGEKLSIITSKAQTTRHRILGIVNGKDFQIVFSDTPGIIINPVNKLHTAMMKFVGSSLADADILLFMTDIFESYDDIKDIVTDIKKKAVPKLLLINKIDLAKENKEGELVSFWEEQKIFDKIFSISALNGNNLELLLKHIIEVLPKFPPYYPKDALTDKPEKYFVEEIIREKIFLFYRQEIPYATEIVVDTFQEDEKIIRIRAEIYVERNTQKVILIGRGGKSLKKVGVEARKDIEKFLGKQVYLELYVKIKDKWRDNPNSLRSFGYQ